MSTALTPSGRVSESWGKRLRKAREAAELTQVAFGELTTFGQTTISRYERGIAPWTPEAMLRFAAVLNLEVDDLFPWPPGIKDVERFRLGVAA